MSKKIAAAHDVFASKNGEGSDFLGWTELPDNYDKEEITRVVKAAEKIQKSCDVFVAIGIGGSYLGARAAIEFCKSPRYTNVKKDTPDIYFAGNDISASNLRELLEICEGRDICINVISKSHVASARIADSLPAPGPLTYTSTVLKPCSFATFAAVSAAI